MARKTYNETTKYKSTYVHGNAVRKLAVADSVVEIPSSTEEYAEAKRRKREQQKQIRRTNKINFLYTIAVTAVVAVIFTICYQYLNLQSTAKTNASEVSTLKQQLSKMTTENDENEVEINASINYDAIYNTAVNELGMVYPDKSHVITYQSGESEYVKQYQDIPSSDK